MSISTSEFLNPIGESQVAERRERLIHLARMVFDLTAERYFNITRHEYDGVENTGLINALRVCSFYTDQIECRDFSDSLVVRIKGIDGHYYVIQFSLFRPGFSVKASRVRDRTLPLVGPDGQVEATYITANVLEEHSKLLKLGKVTADLAFLVGMSLVISFMDDQDDDPDEEARLAPLLALVMPTDDELRELRGKLPPSTINYDDEGDQPYWWLLKATSSSLTTFSTHRAATPSPGPA